MAPAWRVFIGLMAVTALMGCRHLPPQLTLLPGTSTPGPIQAPLVPPPAVLNPSPLGATNVPSRPEVAPKYHAPRDTWVAWDSWSATNGMGPAQRRADEDNTTFEIRSPNGLLTVHAGSRIALWNGLGFWLGYKPHVEHGQLWIHGLDVTKSLAPLLCPTAITLKTNALIVIDPGHGGASAGAKSSVEDRYEKEFTLAWAMNIQKVLTSNGLHVVLTRTNDLDIVLSNRVALAEQLKADLFISLHFNSASGANNAAGLETYCVTPAGMPSSLTREFEDDPKQAYTNNLYDVENLQLAVQIHHALIVATGSLDRSVRRARFLKVLREQNRPAVLIEGGYLSNRVEARRIADPAYLQLLAMAVAQSLIDHRAPAPVTDSAKADPP